jgi:hypothetical protein
MGNAQKRNKRQRKLAAVASKEAENRALCTTCGAYADQCQCAPGDRIMVTQPAIERSADDPFSDAPTVVTLPPATATVDEDGVRLRIDDGETPEVVVAPISTLTKPPTFPTAMMRPLMSEKYVVWVYTSHNMWVAVRSEASPEAAQALADGFAAYPTAITHVTSSVLCTLWSSANPQPISA